jgi:AraC-like DNA-binding protein
LKYNSGQKCTFGFSKFLQTMHYFISEMVSYFGGLMGIILFIVTLSTSKKTKAIKYCLTSFLMVWSAVIIMGALIYSGKIVFLIHLLRLDSPLHYLLGPTVYFFTLSTLKPEFKFKKNHLLHLLPFAINFIEFLPFYFNTAEFKLHYYQNLVARGTVIMPVHYLLKTLSLSGYFVAQLFLFKKYQIKKLQEDKSKHYKVSWFIIYFGCQLILTTTSLIEHFLGSHLFGDPYRFSINIVTFFLYCIMIGLLFFPSVLYGNTVVEKEITKKYKYSKLSNEVKEDILNHLNNFMKGDKKPFLNEKISLDEVSKVLKVSSQQISQVINEKTNLNFNDFVNGYRIEEAKQMLLSNTYSKLTIDAIAQKSGFRSKSAFYLAFKKNSGNTPKEFIAVSLKETPQLNLINSII